jgi:hypothetical protein
MEKSVVRRARWSVTEEHMGLKRVAITTLVVAMALIVGGARAGAEGLPAKASLVQARASARSWRADAVLIRINATTVSVDGTSNLWSYGFYSPRAKTCVVVIVADGKTIDTTESGGAVCAEPELVDFMDSGRAMQIAVKNGISKAGPTMGVMNTPTAKGNRVAWIVHEGLRSGDPSVTIDARTGEVLEKMKMP